MAKRKKKGSPAKFTVGQEVRVRHGVKDVDYPDMPLGGWAGTVIEVRGSDTFIIRWNKETLDAIHPVFKNRCEIDGLDLEVYGLTGDDLEPDSGDPLQIEHPKTITTRPLSPKDEDDRIRMIFGLTSNDPLPCVEDEPLETYHGYLSKNLAFPFRAKHGAEYGHPEPVKVIGLGNPDEEPMIDEMCGILCDARMEGHGVTLPLGELEEPSRNRQLLRDYCYWFHNWSSLSARLDLIFSEFLWAAWLPGSLMVAITGRSDLACPSFRGDCSLRMGREAMSTWD